MTTFALVHGAGHGAWCWDRIVARLEARGHRATAVDLPCEDNAAACTTYADVVTGSLAQVEGDVVLVGHSLGGLTVPLVAARRPATRMVFLCALLPIPGALPFGPDPAAPPMEAPGLEIITHEDATFSFAAASATSHLYNRCTPEERRWATQRLRRQSRAPHAEVCPLPEWPDIDRAYIAARDDRLVLPEYARYVARSRAGVEATLIDADHSPFLSNPDALANALIALA